MKSVVINDTHFGVRNDSPFFGEVISSFLNDQLFPYMLQHGITHIIHAGDLFDKRKVTNTYTIKLFREKFVEPIIKNGFTCDVIVGNHDCYLKNSNVINTPQEFLGDIANFKVFTSAIEKDGLLYIPWICSENAEETFALMNSTSCRFAIGHLEVSGFKMFSNSIESHGYSKDLFSKFEKVLSGHFHHKSDDGKIFYLGVQYDLTWSDWNDPKGFHVFDSSTGSLEFIRNPNTTYHKIFYSDSALDSVQEASVKGKIVKVIVQKKSDEEAFIKFRSQVESFIPHELTIEDIVLDSESDVEIELEEQKSTNELISLYVDNMNEVPEALRVKTKSFLSNLFVEAVNAQ